MLAKQVSTIAGWIRTRPVQVISSQSLSKTRAQGSVAPVNVTASLNSPAQSLFALRRARQLSRTTWGTSVSLNNHHQLSAFPLLNKAQVRLYSTEAIFNNEFILDLQTSPLRTDAATRLITRTIGEKIVVVPPLADSVVEGRILEWRKNVGDQIAVDDVVLTLETDKTSIDLPAKESGVLLDLFGLNVGDTVRVGQNLYKIKLGAVTKTAAKPAAPKESKEAPKEVPKETPKEAPKEAAKPKKEESKPVTSSSMGVTRSERREKMRMIRERIAQRLKASQNTYAMLTTFQECDMSSIMALRDKYKDDFAKRHGVKLGFMSAFVKAAAIALTEWPVVNAVIDGDHIVYRDYVDISVAVATPNGLVVPVIRNAHLLSFAQIEKTLGELAVKAREFKIKVEDTTGGTFTISNGGVYGSLFGTPIINPPQSAILGMHAINKRPVVVTDKEGHDQIAIRPIMYLALTYDHRLIDGLEAVSFLRRIKFLIEDPQRLLLDV